MRRASNAVCSRSVANTWHRMQRRAAGGITTTTAAATAAARQLQQDLADLDVAMVTTRSVMYTGDFGDHMQRCTALYSDVVRGVTKLAEATAAEQGAFLDVDAEVPDEPTDRLAVLGYASLPGLEHRHSVEAHLPADIRAKWVTTDAKWGELLVDVSIM
jgi:hypothetical protein